MFLIFLLYCVSFRISSVIGKNFPGYNYDPPDIDDTISILPLGPPGLDLPYPNPTQPSIITEENNQYLPPNSRFRILNMSCLNSPINGFFRATISVFRNGFSSPIIDDSPSDCITGTGEVYRLDLEEEKMKRCGVKFCSNGVNMCVVIRMPLVQGLKLPEDCVAVLRCQPQERTVTHTKQLKINTQNTLQQSRSVQPTTVITGGLQRNFDTQVGLFRRSGTGNEFTKLISPGAAIQLGEELMLRAVVRDGDGWRFSRLGEVTVHHVTPSGRLRQNALTLLDSSGCRDSRARIICPLDPVQTSPLVTNLGLRAFMFQGMVNGDEMVMSVRVIGCLHKEDCQFKINSCGEELQRSRHRRQISEQKNATGDFHSFLEFRVVAPNITDILNNEIGNSSHINKKIIRVSRTVFVSLISTFCVLFSIIFIIYYIFCKKYF